MRRECEGLLNENLENVRLLLNIEAMLLFFRRFCLDTAFLNSVVIVKQTSSKPYMS